MVCRGVSSIQREPRGEEQRPVALAPGPVVVVVIQIFVVLGGERGWERSGAVEGAARTFQFRGMMMVMANMEHTEKR